MAAPLLGSISAEIDANCAICGAPPVPECPHEGERLQLAFDQALARWAGLQAIRDWVLNHARNAVISTFHALRQARYQQHVAYLQTLPCWTLYHRYGGRPPIPANQLAMLHQQIHSANAAYKAGVDEDWRRSCMEYPKVLDYYFGLVDISLPEDRDEAVRDPVFGGAAPVVRAGAEQRRVKARRDSIDTQPRKKERRRSRGRTPPAAPMVGQYRR